MPRIPVINTSHLDRIDELLVDNFETGEFKLHRSVFTDQAMFDLEMKYIFEGNWVYLAHESQIPNNNDYYTTHIGRQPIIIARNRAGELNAMINACSHRGAQLCRYKRGNKATYTCPFHGWTFNNSGKLLKVKDPADAGYSDCFCVVHRLTPMKGTGSLLQKTELMATTFLPCTGTMPRQPSNVRKNRLVIMFGP